MEKPTRERLQGAVQEQPIDERIAQWVAALERHAVKGRPEHLMVEDEEAFLKLLVLLGHESVESLQVIAYSYATNYGDHDGVGERELPFSGPRELMDLITRISLIGINSRFPNDFKVRLAIALDSETMVAYGYDSSSRVSVCEECRSSLDLATMEDVALNPGYGCEHSIEEYSSSFCASVMKRTDSSRALQTISTT